MLIKALKDCQECMSKDHTYIRELLHPEKDSLPISFSLAHACLKPDSSSHPHRLSFSEMYYIFQGSGEMHIDNETRKVSKNQVIYIPPKSIQYLINTGTEDLLFLCIVCPPWNSDAEEIIL